AHDAAIERRRGVDNRRQAAEMTIEPLLKFHSETVITCQDARAAVHQRALHFSRRPENADRKRVEIFPRPGAIRPSRKFAEKRTRAVVRRVSMTVDGTRAEAE